MASRKDTAAAFFDDDVAPQTPAEMLAILQRFRDELVVAGGGNLPAATGEQPQQGRPSADERKGKGVLMRKGKGHEGRKREGDRVMV